MNKINFQRKIYLNHADGRKSKTLARLYIANADKLHRFLTVEFRKILGISTNNFLSLSQNATTSFIRILIPILTEEECPIYLSNHEIRWFKNVFFKGEMPMNEVTYPGYAHLRAVPFFKRKIHLFDPEQFIKNPGKVIGKKPAIVVISHISRITGEIFLTPSLFKKIKKLNPQNLVVADGGQAVGAIQFDARKIADAYIGVTSKFIQAEPHIGFCWISNKVVMRFHIAAWDINPHEFRREIYSALQHLKKSLRDKNVARLKKIFISRLKKVGIRVLRVPHQANHFLIIPSKNPMATVIALEKKGIIVSANIGWSVAEPKVSGIRVSIFPQLKIEEITQAVQAFSEIKKDGLV